PISSLFGLPPVKLDASLIERLDAQCDDATARALIEILLEREELRRALGPKRLKAFDDARALRHAAEMAEAEGHHGGELVRLLMIRFRVSKSTVYLRLGRRKAKRLGNSCDDRKVAQ